MKKVKMGMIGGGPGAFIGEVHRMAARLDGKIELVGGAFSSDPASSKAFGQSLAISPSRSYGDFKEMIKQESQLPPDERMDFVVIATPNHLHFEPAKLALEKGFHVLSDKPATLHLQEAEQLSEIVQSSGLLYGLTHNYTGYPLVKEARQLIRNGQLGKIRKVVVEYPQGWLSTQLEATGHKQASWRTDPQKAGAGSLGDIGTHAENLAEYVTGLKIKELCADVSSIVEGRQLDDDANILVRFDNGARGIIYCSQVSLGEENPLSFRVYGTKASLEWHQMEPNTLLMKYLDKPTEIFRAGQGYLSETAQSNSRIPPGHPEGFIEAFANLYVEFAKAIRHYQEKKEVKAEDFDFPNIQDAVRGMQFIERVMQSSKSSEKWTKCLP
jgi:predicted dehydrogenase